MRSATSSIVASGLRIQVHIIHTQVKLHSFSCKSIHDCKYQQAKLSYASGALVWPSALPVRERFLPLPWLQCHISILSEPPGLLDPAQLAVYLFASARTAQALVLCLSH